MGGGFRSRSRDGKRDATDTTLVDEAGIRVTEQAVVTERQEYALDQVVDASARTEKPLWGPLILGVLGTVNLAAGFQTGAARDFAAAGVMLGAGVLWWRLGTRHTLTLNVGGKGQDVWSTRDRGVMNRVVAAVGARVDAIRDR